VRDQTRGKSNKAGRTWGEKKVGIQRELNKKTGGPFFDEPPKGKKHGGHLSVTAEKRRKEFNGNRKKSVGE